MYARRPVSYGPPLSGGSVSLAAAVLSHTQQHGSLVGRASLSGGLVAHLRWVRFATRDSHATMDFYIQVMKMTLDRQVDTGAKVRTCMQYPGDQVGLRFDFDAYATGQQHHHQTTRTTEAATRDTRIRKEATTTDATSLGDPSSATIRPPVRAALPIAPTSSVSLVVYVDSVNDYLTRCRESGFVVYIDAVTVCEEPLIRSAVILDPMGLKIRLMEGEVYQLNKLRSRGRLAYVSVPIKDYSAVEKSITFYEDTFQSARASQAKASNANGAAPADPTAPPKKGVGFRLVDMERFVEELTTYVWFANGNRKKHTAVCLFHRVQRKSVHGTGTSAGASGGANDWNDSGESDQEPPEDGTDDGTHEREHLQTQMALIDRNLEASEEESKIFLGLSFSVPDIEQAVNFLRNADLGSGQPTTTSASGSSSSRLEIQHLPGFPRFISLVDPTSMSLELTDGAMGVAHMLTSIHSTGHAAMQHDVGTATLRALHAPPSQSTQPRVPHIAPSPPRSTHQPRPPSASRRSARASPTSGSDSDETPYGDEWSDSGRTGRRILRHADGGSDAESVSSDDEDALVGMAASMASALGASHANISGHNRGHSQAAKRRTPQFRTHTTASSHSSQAPSRPDSD